MNRSRAFRRLVALSSAVLLTLSVAVPAATAKPPEDGPAANKAKTTKVQILSLNDFHGQLRPPDGVNSSGGRIGPIHAGGAEYLASYLRQLEATNPKNTLFVSAGDLIGATPLISAIFHDEPSIEAMNLMGLDYNGVGNHEFDEGAAELTRMQEGGCHPVDGCFGGDGFAGADFDFLAANVTYKATGETIFPPYAIHEFPGVDIAVVGMTLEGTPSIVTAAATADIDFHDEADSVNALVPVLKEQGIETIIVLLHEGGSAPAITEASINACNGVGGHRDHGRHDPPQPGDRPRHHGPHQLGRQLRGLRRNRDHDDRGRIRRPPHHGHRPGHQPRDQGDRQRDDQ